MDLNKLASALWAFLARLFLETGTFTPEFAGSGTAGVFTYVVGRQDGRYTRIANVVLFALDCGISAIGTPPTGVMSITGLPFAALGNEAGAVFFAQITNINYAAAALDLTGFIQAGTSTIQLFESFDNAATVAMPAANFTNVNAQVRLVGVYWID